MLVREVMTSDPVTIPAQASLREGIQQMLAAEVGYAIVVDDDGNPGGFITEDDIMQTVYQAGPPPDEIKVVAVADPPDVTVEPSTTVRKAARRMTAENVSAVLVMDGLSFAGVLTFADIVAHLGMILQQAAASEQAEQQELNP